MRPRRFTIESWLHDIGGTRRVLFAACLSIFSASAATCQAQLPLAGSMFSESYHLTNSRARMAIVNPPTNGNFSGVTYSATTNSLFVVDNGPSHIYEFDLNGFFRRTIATTGFDDAEGIVWMGGNQFGFLEEKISHVNILTIGPTTTSIAKSQLPAGGIIRPDLFPADPSRGALNPTGDNVGMEGIAYDPLLDRFYLTKEKADDTPGDYGVNVFAVDRSGQASVLFNPSVAHGSSTVPLTSMATDISDAHFDPVSRNLLILSHESRRIIEVGLNGEVRGTRDLPGTQIEGLTILPDHKTLFVIGESREFFRYESSPELTALIPPRALWKYQADGSDQGTAWRERTFSDAAWPQGFSELGYGDLDEATAIRCGPTTTCLQSNDPTKYFRHRFDVSSPGRISELKLGLQRDDGAAVYLNGVEVYRDASLNAAAAYNNFANQIGPINDPEEDFFVYVTIDPSLLRSGENVLAVEVHQYAGTDLDLSFNAQLIARYAAVPEPPGITLALAGALGAGFFWRRRRVSSSSLPIAR
jgi:uncharacterized protein YjiK